MGWLDFWNWRPSQAPPPSSTSTDPLILHDETLPMALSPDNYVSAGIKFCTSPAGRYGFILGTTMYRKRTSKTEFLSTLRLDIIDFWTNERHKTTIHDLTRCGNYFVHFYAIDESTLVLVDHNQSLSVITQRLVLIDHEKRKIEVPFERRYTLTTSPFSMIKLAIGKNVCAVLAAQPLFDEWQLILIPKFPLFNLPDKLIDPTVTMNRSLLPALQASTNCVDIAYRLTPFFTEKDRKLNFFVTNLETRCLDSDLRIATMDIVTGECRIRLAKPDPKSMFPYSGNIDCDMPVVADCATKQHGATNVLLAARYRPSQGAVREIANNLIMGSTNMLLNVLFRFVGIDTKVFGDIFINSITMLVKIRSKIMLPVKVRVGILDVETFQWRFLTENEADFNSMHATLTGDDQKIVILHREFNQEAKSTRHWVEFNLLKSMKCDLKAFAMKALLSKRNDTTSRILTRMCRHREYVF
uniref:Uncharacterized protein n=1 Tax=Panagrellus redivivus TaxID=6233 RepID=A0A7E4VRN7_PANRE